ncbi:MAG: signal peptidase I [Candidatus Dormibacteria bacterium]
MGIWSVLVVVVLAAAGIATFSVLSGGWTVTPILSGSMRPGFPVGGVAVAERMPMDRLAVGDVILFQNPYQPSVQMVHRIIQLNIGDSGQPVVRTKGDANPVADPWTVTLHGKDVYVVQFTLPLLGYPAVYTNHGVDLMVGGAILLIVVVGTVVARERHGRRGRADPERGAAWRVQQIDRPESDGDSRWSEWARPDVRASDERPGAPPVVAERSDSRAPSRERPE